MKLEFVLAASNDRALLGWFALLLGLSLFSRWEWRHERSGRCSLDGNRIAPVHQVDLMADGRVLESFCCVSCAEEWPDVPPESYWRVRDEVTGEPLDASAACFVESSVVTVPARRDHVHAFGSWPEAMSHIAEYGGERLANPLAPASAEGAR